MELAIDTSTRYASVALAYQGKLQWEQSWCSKQNHTVELLPTIESLLSKAQTAVRDLTGIVVANGPGNFSALRVGISLAKGLATGFRIPIVGINTLLIEAFPYLNLGMPVYAVLDAGRGEVVWACFVEEGNAIQSSTERVTDWETLWKQVTPPALVCGEGLSQQTEESKEWRSRGILMITRSIPTRRASSVVELGAQRLMRDEHDDIATLEPIYIRGLNIIAPRRA